MTSSVRLYNRDVVIERPSEALHSFGSVYILRKLTRVNNMERVSDFFCCKNGFRGPYFFVSVVMVFRFQRRDAPREDAGNEKRRKSMVSLSAVHNWMCHRNFVNLSKDESCKKICRSLFELKLTRSFIISVAWRNKCKQLLADNWMARDKKYIEMKNWLLLKYFFGKWASHSLQVSWRASRQENKHFHFHKFFEFSRTSQRAAACSSTNW